MTPAARLTNEIRLATSRVGARLFVVTVGKFWGPFSRGHVFTKPATVQVNKGDVLIRNGHMVSVGTKGQSDLGGWVSVVVTPEMVGQTVAIYAAVEVKTPTDTMRDGQQEYIDAVNNSGGRAGVARSPEEAIRICSGD